MIFKDASKGRYRLLPALVLAVACNLPVEESAYEEKLVVFGHLVASGQTADTIFVSRSFEIEESHEDQSKWVADATVTIFDGETTFVLAPVAGRPGRYLEQAPPRHIIRPGWTYRLDVVWGDDQVTAFTTVPDSFALTSTTSSDWLCEGEPVPVDSIALYEDEYSETAWRQAVASGDFSALAMDTVIYREGPCHTTSFASIPLFLLKWETFDPTGIIRVSTLALDDTVSHAIVDSSLAANIFKGPLHVDEDGNHFRPGSFVWNSSIGNIPFTWLYFNYYGPHLITVEVTDDHFSEYFEGNPLRQSNFSMPTSNIEGGYGLFSSSNARSFFVHVVPDTS